MAGSVLATVRAALYLKPMIYASLLDDRAVVALRGAEARDFLQGLITNDMAACVPRGAIYAGLLTPQGKLLFEFFVVAEGENSFLIDCAAARAGDLVKRLTLYRLRAKIEIAAQPRLAVAALWGEGAGQAEVDATVFPDPRLPALGWRAIGERGGIAAAVGSLTAGDYATHRLSLGVPGSDDLPPDQVFALDAGFEELNGVSFKKGCYVGQEVTARMKHRASARRRFVIVHVGSALPPSGTGLEAEGRDVGTLATGKGYHALALVRLDRLADAEEKQAPITVGGQQVRLERPAWMKI